MEQLRDVLAKKCYETLSGEKRELLPDWISPKKPVVLVVPVDSAAPKGRLILPQQMVLRAVLDKGAYSIVTKETELKEVLETMGEKPQLVITDSQAFSYVSSIVSDGSTAHFFFNFDGPVQRRSKTPGGGSRCAGPFGRGSKDPYL